METMLRYSFGSYRTKSNTSTSSNSSTTSQRSAVYLPPEIIDHILNLLLEHRIKLQTTLAKCCLINKSWYEAAIPRLYARPRLTIPTYPNFVRTVAPTRFIAGHQEMMARDFGSLVLELDLRHLSFAGEASETARLIGRCKKSLRVFQAPVCPPTGASSFGNVCFVALGNCTNLLHLDLTLCGAAKWTAMQRMLKHIPNLVELYLPNTGHAFFAQQIPYFYWPSTLKSLKLSRCGAPMINALARRSAHSSAIPALEKLVIQDGVDWDRAETPWTGVLENRLFPIIEVFALHLRELVITNIGTENTPQIALIIPDLPGFCPNLRVLTIQENAFRIPPYSSLLMEPAHPLRHLTLLPASDGDTRQWLSGGIVSNINPFAVLHILQNGRLLGNLQTVSYYPRTRWVLEPPDGIMQYAMDQIDEVLVKRWEGRGVPAEQSGVFAVEAG